MVKKNSNDSTILALKGQIEYKKNALKATEKFSPVTNCSLEVDNVRYNIHVLTKEQIIPLLIKLNSYKMSAEALGLLNDYTISGFSLKEWIQDLQAKLMNVNRKVEEDRLRRLEEKLHNLLSNDTKVELEIEEIKSML
jgi:hypothetical protein